MQVGKIATHILGLDAVCDTILKLPEIPGGKKVCYTHKSFPLTAVENIQDSDEFSKGLQEIIARHGGLWRQKNISWSMAKIFNDLEHKACKIR